MKHKIFIILPTHNRVDTTITFIHCLLHQTYSNFCLIVVDDASYDGTTDAVLSVMPKAIVLNGNGDLWWAGSLQKGIKYLNDTLNPKMDDIVLFANDDTVFDADFFEKAVNILDQNSRTLLLPKWKIGDDVSIVETGVYYDSSNFTFRHVTHQGEINLFTTMCLFLRWSDVVEIGNFHPILLPHYNSDSEYTYRAYKKGFRLITQDDFWIIPDRTKTGFHKNDFKNMKIGKFMRSYFSRKSSSNPFCKLSMVLLTSPFYRIIPNFLKIMYVVMNDMAISISNSISGKQNKI